MKIILHPPPGMHPANPEFVHVRINEDVLTLTYGENEIDAKYREPLEDMYIGIEVVEEPPPVEPARRSGLFDKPEDKRRG